MSHHEEQFDFIIIGGGTAGLVVANRLSEDPNLRILILEAGKNRNEDPRVAVPGFMTQLWANPDTDWCFNSVPQAGLNNKVIPQTRGKVLGGTSAVNALATIYPSKKIFDIWTELGNSGWDAETMTPYFKKFQALQQPSQELEEELKIDYMDYSLYGSGPVHTSISKFNLKLPKVWSDTVASIYGRASTDPIRGSAIGAFTCPNYIDPVSSTRSHAGVAYYAPVSSRTNLYLVENALVEKILFSESKNGLLEANGVQYVVDGNRQISRAQKEIVLSAGAFNSPMILELSGIGNEDLLKSHGINVAISNPNVGENLQDHPMTIISLEAANDTDSLDSLSDPKLLGEALRLLKEQLPGPLTAGLNAMAFLPVTAVLDPKDTIDFERFVSKTINDNLEEYSPAQKIQADRIASISLDPTDSTAYLAGAPAGFLPEMTAQGVKCLSMVAALVHPLSRGSCHIRSSEPTAAPVIDPRYLSHPLDLEVLAQHNLHLSKLASVEPLASMFKKGGRSSAPTGSLESIEAARIWTRNATSTQFHPCGTCAMMPKESGGVVDDRLVVYGTSNLRVIDASIFPMIPKGPITSTVYAVAERASDLIKADMKSSGIASK